MATYKPLQSVALTSATESVTFSGIDQGYTDLVLVANTILASGTGPECSLRFNGDTGGNYSNTYLLGTGSSAVSGRGSNFTYADCGYLSANSGNPNTRIINITNYSNTTTNKTVISRGSSVNGIQVIAYANLWRNTAAITSITVFSQSGNYSAGSTFDLYGIKSGAPQALGGDLVTTDGNYWYHTFRTTQTFTPQRPLTVDYLVVAGGGGGGRDLAGGGGAGGFRTGTAFSVTAIPYTITVGAGGPGSTTTPATSASDGANSIFSTITSTGGGGGGSNFGVGRAGGSGGGGSRNAAGGAGNTPSTSPSQGNNGGTASQSPDYTSGGGGGASAAGGAGTASVGGAGGNGTASSISGTSVTYAGGGGGANFTGTAGGAGGTGGGGTGGIGFIEPTAGTQNLGAGGGGGNNQGSLVGANGGSGIVIVRYPV
jgi:hypothetical protein